MHSRRYSAFISYRHAGNTQEGSSDRILAIIIAGESNTDDPASRNCHA